MELTHLHYGKRASWLSRSSIVADMCQLAEAGPHCSGLQVRDHACCVLCLYELWALPLRLAVGTAYNRLGPSQYACPSCGFRCARQALKGYRTTECEH